MTTHEGTVMDFFGIGFGEVLLILIVALIIWGPARVAEVGKTLGRTVHTFRKATSDLTSQLSREIEEEEKKHTPLSRSHDAGKTPPQDNQKNS